MITDPDRDCSICPRLRNFILEKRTSNPDWYNAPVDTWLPQGGEKTVKILVVGLAPGLKGANRTGRPFTGDFAGDLLYETLELFSLTRGTYGGDVSDDLQLVDCAITNAVRCVPPKNKPDAAEINNCRPFLLNTISRFPNLQCLVTLGKISHDSCIRALALRLSDYPFVHGQEYETGPYTIVPSYHCSRYNTNTGRLTKDMFKGIFHKAMNTIR